MIDHHKLKEVLARVHTELEFYDDQYRVLCSEMGESKSYKANPILAEVEALIKELDNEQA